MMRKPRLGELFKARGPMMMKMMVVIRAVVKNGLFTVRLTVRGVGAGREGSVPPSLTVSKCENFGPIFLIIKW